MFTCLFAARGTDLRGPLRSGADDSQLEARIRAAWHARDDRYSDLRSAGTTGLPRVEMFAIGG
jgi:cyclic pyranopterin phosphate synthase